MPADFNPTQGERVVWTATVISPEGGLSLNLHFEGESPAALLRTIADAVDLSDAESVVVRMNLDDGAAL